MINAAPGDLINLRGLVIEGLFFPSNTIGIGFYGGASLNVQQSSIRGFFRGIDVRPHAPTKFFVSDTIIADNIENGIDCELNANSPIDVVVERVLLQFNKQWAFKCGGNAGGVGRMTFSNSTATGSQRGIRLATNFGGNGSLMVANSTIAHNSVVGINTVSDGSVIRVTRSRISGNQVGVEAFGGTIMSYGDNNLDGNTNDGAFSSTITTK